MCCKMDWVALVALDTVYCALLPLTIRSPPTLGPGARAHTQYWTTWALLAARCRHEVMTCLVPRVSRDVDAATTKRTRSHKQCRAQRSHCCVASDVAVLMTCHCCRLGMSLIGWRRRLRPLSRCASRNAHAAECTQELSNAHTHAHMHVGQPVMSLQRFAATT
jgi:hypothetical protein